MGCTDGLPPLFRKDQGPAEIPPEQAELTRLRAIERRLMEREDRAEDDDEAETLHWIRTGKVRG